MLRKLAIGTLLLGSAIAFAQPAAARNRDDHRGDSYSYRDNRGRADGEHERGEWREHERRENRLQPYFRNSGYNGYYNGSYGYNGAYGYGNYSNGYYDQFGNWCQR